MDQKRLQSGPVDSSGKCEGPPPSQFILLHTMMQRIDRGERNCHSSARKVCCCILQRRDSRAINWQPGASNVYCSFLQIIDRLQRSWQPGARKVCCYILIMKHREERNWQPSAKSVASALCEAGIENRKTGFLVPI